MTQEDKKLLLKDLCARLPYGVKIYFGGIPKQLTSITIKSGYIEILVEGEYGKAAYCDASCTYNNAEYLYEEITEKCKPYLRPMSSMTDEEQYICRIKRGEDLAGGVGNESDYLNSIHVDYRGLIEKGLAIEVTEENNPYK